MGIKQRLTEKRLRKQIEKQKKIAEQLMEEELKEQQEDAERFKEELSKMKCMHCGKPFCDRQVTEIFNAGCEEVSADEEVEKISKKAKRIINRDELSE